MKYRMPRTAMFLGVSLAVFSFAGVYLAVTYLPRTFGMLLPIVFLLVPIVALWPTRFDEDRTARWPLRLGRRMATILPAAVVAGLVSVVIGLAIPQFSDWSDNQHRAALRRRGMAEAEIEQQVAAHHQTPTHNLRDGAFSVGVPGTIAALVTTVAGAVMFRRRRTP